MPYNALTVERKMAIYYGEWSNYAQVHDDYRDRTPPEADIVYAGYTYEYFSGNAIVVYRKDGELYENNDSHCSCHGLECWEPEKTNADALRIRKGWPGLVEALDAA